MNQQANHVEIILIKNLQQNQSLSPLNISLEEITVTGQSKDNMVRQNELGSLRMDVKEMSEIPVLFPSGKYEIDNNIVNYYTSRNGYRMPAYHRLDLGATLQLKKRKHFTSELSFGLYNVYARKNAYSIIFRTNENNPNLTEAVKIYLFTAIPSITWNFKF